MRGGNCHAVRPEQKPIGPFFELIWPNFEEMTGSLLAGVQNCFLAGGNARAALQEASRSFKKLSRSFQEVSKSFQEVFKKFQDLKCCVLKCFKKL